LIEVEEKGLMLQKSGQAPDWVIIRAVNNGINYLVTYQLMQDFFPSTAVYEVCSFDWAIGRLKKRHDAKGNVCHLSDGFVTIESGQESKRRAKIRKEKHNACNLLLP